MFIRRRRARARAHTPGIGHNFQQMYALRERYGEESPAPLTQSYVRSKSKNDISSVLIELVSRMRFKRRARARAPRRSGPLKEEFVARESRAVPLSRARAIKGARLLSTGISTCQARLLASLLPLRPSISLALTRDYFV